MKRRTHFKKNTSNKRRDIEPHNKNIDFMKHQEKIRAYTRKYFEDRKRKLDEINMKTLKSNPIPTFVDAEEISRPVKMDKRKETDQKKKETGAPYGYGSILSNKTKSIRRNLRTSKTSVHQ